MNLPWETVRGELVPELSAADRHVVEATAYGSTRGLGSAPALLLVDFQLAYLGRDVPIAEQLGEFPTGGGANAWRAMRRSLPLVDVARSAGIPIVLTRIAYPAGAENAGGFAAKRGASALFVDGEPGTRFCPELESLTEAIRVRKEAASAFHDTRLDETLAELAVDTVLVAGLSTSGCVRATVVDAASHGYRAAVLRDATADRIELSGRVALFDLWMKYADVIDVDAAIRYVQSVSLGKDGN